MRRTLLVTSLAVGLGLSVLAPAAGAGGDHRIRLPHAPAATPATTPSPRAALTRAQEVLTGTPARTTDATLALRDLFTSLPRLSGTDRTAARQLLARPGLKRKACSPHVCVHWNTGGPDAATGRWARRTLSVVDAVWRLEIGRLGYRAPAPDHGGGDSRLDVYLKDVGARRLYGYCEPEYNVPGSNQRRASGYCVLDNDFARGQFGTRPLDALRVTAAHEFFHASQFNYDYREDHWFMEATATWMEERFADDVNDNRQYLPASQLAEPTQPLDTFNQYGSNQYGNWVFFEHLSERWGLKIVRRIWNDAIGAKTYSIEAVSEGLPDRHPLPEVYAAFTAANTIPPAFYAEGRHWPRPPAKDVFLGANDQTTGNATIDHLANVPIRLHPKADLDTRDWQLQVSVDGPPLKTSPEATIVWQRDSGKVVTVPVVLNNGGRGQALVPFNRPQVHKLYVVLANASTRYDCSGSDPTYSCGGTPLDDGSGFQVDLAVLPR